MEIIEGGSSIQRKAVLDFVLQQMNDKQYQLKTITNGQQKTRYTFHIQPLDDKVFMKAWIKSFDYINEVVASRFIDDQFIYINGNYVQIRSRGNVEKYDSEAKALEYLKLYFEFDKSIVQTAKELLNKHRKRSA